MVEKEIDEIGRMAGLRKQNENMDESKKGGRGCGRWVMGPRIVEECRRIPKRMGKA
jgi:hypothetical protein